MPAFLIPAAMAVASGVASMISESARAEEEAKKRDAANKLLERSIIGEAELGRMLRSQTRMFNAQLQNTINTTAIRSSGIANQGVVGAAAAGQVKAAEGVALAQTEQQVADRNAEIRTKQAMITMGADTATDPVGSFVSGGISGGIAGAQFGRTLGLLNKLPEDQFAMPAEGGAANVGSSPVGPLAPETSVETPYVAGPFDVSQKPTFGLSTTPGQMQPEEFTGYNPYSISNKPNLWMRR